MPSGVHIFNDVKNAANISIFILIRSFSQILYEITSKLWSGTTETLNSAIACMVDTNFKRLSPVIIHCSGMLDKTNHIEVIGAILWQMALSSEVSSNVFQFC